MVSTKITSELQRSKGATASAISVALLATEYPRSTATARCGVFIYIVFRQYMSVVFRVGSSKDSMKRQSLVLALGVIAPTR